MKVYIQRHNHGAGKWIYKGYFNAWKFLNYEPIFFNNIEEIDTNQEYYLMTLDSLAVKNAEIIKKSKNTFLFVQPNYMPLPWGSHDNFKCLCSEKYIHQINNVDKIIKWSFLDVNTNNFCLWKNVNTLPLAFDDISYTDRHVNYKYDLCFIGGIANNGFNEKINIINKTLSFFENKRDIKCSFHVNKNISHEQENEILSNSKICLNIHDNYQRTLGLDTNERTFKSLGLSGILISDKVNQLNNLFKDVYTTNDLLLMYNEIKRLLTIDLSSLRNSSKKLIFSKHLYKNRVESLLSYVN